MSMLAPDQLKVTQLIRENRFTRVIVELRYRSGSTFTAELTYCDFIDGDRLPLQRLNDLRMNQKDLATWLASRNGDFDLRTCLLDKMDA